MPNKKKVLPIPKIVVYRGYIYKLTPMKGKGVDKELAKELAIDAAKELGKKAISKAIPIPNILTISNVATFITDLIKKKKAPEFHQWHGRPFQGKKKICYTNKWGNRACTIKKRQIANPDLLRQNGATDLEFLDE